MRSSLRSCLLTALLLSTSSLVASQSRAEDPESNATDNQEEVIERILELRQQIEELLEILPEDVRHEVEKRWRDRQRSSDEEAPQETATVEPATDLQEPAESAVESTPEAMRSPEDEPAEDPMPEIDLEAEVESPEVSTPPCGGFHLFDTNEDFLVSGGDRLWRFFRLWFDGNDDGFVQETEIEGLFELGVRQIDVELSFYTNEDGDSEDVDVDEFVWLRTLGKGKAQRRSGVLVVAGDRLIRDGRLWLTDADGAQLDGTQPLSDKTILEDRDGQRTPVFCQSSE